MKEIEMLKHLNLGHNFEYSIKVMVFKLTDVHLSYSLRLICSFLLFFRLCCLSFQRDVDRVEVTKVVVDNVFVQILSLYHDQYRFQGRLSLASSLSFSFRF